MDDPSGWARARSFSATHDREHVRAGVGIDVGVPRIRREAEAPGERLPSEVRRARPRGARRRRPSSPAPRRRAHQEHGARAREQDHAVQEPEQAPGGLVRDRGVRDEHQERVEAEEAQGPRIRPGDSVGAQPAAPPTSARTRMSPSVQKGVPLDGEVDQQPQVVGPGVDVPRRGPGPVQVEPVGAHGVHDAPGWVRKEEKNAADDDGRREQGQQHVPAGHDAARLRGGRSRGPSGRRGGSRRAPASMQPRARGAVSLVATISPAHAPARRAGGGARAPAGSGRPRAARRS